jgi:hypothetical protein
VRLPATFTVRRGGTVTPPSVSSPAFIAIQLTVISGDGKRHQAILRTPTPHTVSVPAGGTSRVLIAGQRPGHYALVVDGAPRGAVVVGGEPGP